MCFCFWFADGLLVFEPQGSLLPVQAALPKDLSVVLRRHARDVYDAALYILSPATFPYEDYPLKPARPEFSISSRVAIVGSPGIGKSRNLVYPLMRLLAQDRLVIFEHVQKHRLIALVPSGQDPDHNDAKLEKKKLNYHAYITSNKSNAIDDCAAIKNPDVFYIRDPGSSEAGSDPPNVPARTLIAASPDPRHLGELVKHSMTPLYMSAWKADELKTARPFMIASPAISDAVFNQRLSEVGCIPRYILDARQYAFRLNKMKALLDDPNSGEVLSKIASMLQTQPTDRLTETNPLSAVFVLESQFPFLLENTSIEFVSDFVVSQLAKKHAEAVWTHFKLRTDREVPSAHKLLESGVFSLLTNKQYKCRVRRLGPASPSSTKKLEKLGPYIPKVCTGSTMADGVEAFDKLLQVKVPATLMRFSISNSNQPVVDLVDSAGRGFNCTMAQKHDIKCAKLDEILKLPFFKEHSKPFKLYFIVPPDNFDGFALTIPPIDKEKYDKLIDTNQLQVFAMTLLV